MALSTPVEKWHYGKTVHGNTAYIESFELNARMYIDTPQGSFFARAYRILGRPPDMIRDEATEDIIRGSLRGGYHCAIFSTSHCIYSVFFL